MGNGCRRACNHRWDIRGDPAVSYESVDCDIDDDPQRHRRLLFRAV